MIKQERNPKPVPTRAPAEKQKQIDGTSEVQEKEEKEEKATEQADAANEDEAEGSDA